ncbi:MAG: PHP domain-containing protein [Candidatus Aureabacteria bacterium]|nr:PHP domain-containing protein [Candidatus Auribacterota bacterium]NLW94902.1 PHP domain-containing protein [Chlamydiota bacterium]HOE26571.1 PHP domain-containing protein [bacterium]HQM53207.1 PHP domain-containing protein [bacterium]
MRIDLHVHTNASDGLFAPAEVVRKAREAGLSALGIADHDTVNGVEEALQAAGEERIEVVPAVEINAYHGAFEYHILGYFLDHRDERLGRALAELREARIVRMRRIVEKLGALGMEVDPEEIFAAAGGGSVGRPHIARVMLQRRYVSSMREAFDRFIGEGKPAYAPRSKLAPGEAIALIREASGVAVLAHPGLWGGDELIPQLAAWGIAGIEVYTPDHTGAQRERYRGFARDLGLIQTGGSDYHGWKDNSGNTLGAAATPPGEFRRLAELAGAARVWP